MTAAIPTFPTCRLRRLRTHPKMRDLVRETQLQVSDLVQPLFITHGSNIRSPISSMPGQFHLSVDQLEAEIAELHALNVHAVLLFGIPQSKDGYATGAYADDGVIQQAIAKIKSTHPDMLIITDVCCCDYADHGHCGVIQDKNGVKDVDNDATLSVLQKIVLSYVRAGADVVAPSGHMDGMVHAIRSALDQANFHYVPIMSYSMKFSSSLYGPFREALDSAPQFGDRKTYQMDPANGHEAMREAQSDIAEGADILMVKPATSFLDVVARIKDAYPQVPMAAYHVSGEYAMVKAAAENGWLDEQKTFCEILTSIKRAGADIIISYATKDVAKWLQP